MKHAHMQWNTEDSVPFEKAYRNEKEEKSHVVFQVVLKFLLACLGSAQRSKVTVGCVNESALIKWICSPAVAKWQERIIFALEYKHLCSGLCGIIYRDILKLIQVHLRVVLFCFVFLIPQYDVNFSIQKLYFIVFNHFSLLHWPETMTQIFTFTLN